MLSAGRYCRRRFVLLFLTAVLFLWIRVLVVAVYVVLVTVLVVFVVDVFCFRRWCSLAVLTVLVVFVVGVPSRLLLSSLVPSRSCYSCPLRPVN